MNNDIEAKLKRIEGKVSSILQETKKQPETWVKVGIITELTGWDAERMRRARLNGLIKWKKTDTGFWYLLESVNDRFIKKAI